MSATREDRRQLAERVRAACVQAVQAGYERAKIAGLCEDGALEAALSAIHMLDIDAVVGATSEHAAPQKKK